MPQIGDTKEVFGRRYVYANPDQALGPGTWQLADSPTAAEAGDAQAVSLVYGSAQVADDAQLIEQGMLIRLDDNGKAYPALASTPENARVVGVAIDRTNVGQVVRFTMNTSFEMFNADKITDEETYSLQIGRAYYLSSLHPGRWTLEPKSNARDFLVLQCGIAVSDNHMAIDIQQNPQNIDLGRFD